MSAAGPSISIMGARPDITGRWWLPEREPGADPEAGVVVADPDDDYDTTIEDKRPPPNGASFALDWWSPIFLERQGQRRLCLVHRYMEISAGGLVGLALTASDASTASVSFPIDELKGLDAREVRKLGDIPRELWPAVEHPPSPTDWAVLCRFNDGRMLPVAITSGGHAHAAELVDRIGQAVSTFRQRQASSTVNNAESPPLPSQRTEEWRRATAFLYESISIEDRAAAITIWFRSARLQLPGAGPALVWRLGQMALFLGLLIGFLVGMTQGTPGLYVWAAAAAFFALCWRGASASRKGQITITPDEVSFRETQRGGAPVRRVARNLVGGAAVQTEEEYNFVEAYRKAGAPPPQQETVFYVLLRYGAVNSVLGGFKARAPAEQLAMLINEALRQPIGMQPQTVQTKTAEQRITITRNDDL